MGMSRWDGNDWNNYSAKNSTKKREEIFTNNSLNSELDPKNIKIRESRDSEINPNSNAIIVGVDVTGSMGINADQLVRKGLGTLVGQILERKPVSDPHIMCMGIGDVACDSAPLQVTQFEADLKIAKSLEQIWLEKGGGGNGQESYTLPWYFASKYTSIDCFEKRNKKGYLFTMGDEKAPKKLTAAEINRVFNNSESTSYTSEELLEMVSRSYHVFHIIVEQGYYVQNHREEVVSSWEKLLGERVLKLRDNDDLAEVIVSAIQVIEGAEVDDVVSSWSDSKAISVKHAINQLSSEVNRGGNGGLIKF